MTFGTSCRCSGNILRTVLAALTAPCPAPSHLTPHAQKHAYSTWCERGRQGTPGTTRELGRVGQDRKEQERGKRRLRDVHVLYTYVNIDLINVQCKILKHANWAQNLSRDIIANSGPLLCVGPTQSTHRIIFAYSSDIICFRWVQSATRFLVKF